VGRPHNGYVTGPLRAILSAALAVACWAMATAPAQAAASCAEPGASWQQVSPAAAGMDAAKLQDALDYGSSQAGFAVRVYRGGCLVGEDRAADANRDRTFESYSMAKSLTSLIFGRAMQLGLISPYDPVGSLLPEADRAHGAITLRDLLTQSSGLRWNGFRDYNVFTMPDRVRDALTLGIAHPPGTYFEYAQSPVALLAEAVGRSAGEDTGAFTQRELTRRLGIADTTWYWSRDPAGHVQGFYGVNMRPDDFGRLGELLRRGGNWRGARLLSPAYVRDAVAPSPTNGCYGWLIWVNAGAPCVYPTVSKRPVKPTRDFPDLPGDMYNFSGLFGQRVTVFPSQKLLIVRMGQDPGLVPAGTASWEHELYVKVLAAITDQRIPPPGPPPKGPDQQDKDYGFQTALSEPDQYSKGFSQDPLPPAGPERARAALLSLARSRAGAKGIVAVRLACPPRWPGRKSASCVGVARLQGARRLIRYSVPAGRSKALRFRITRKRLRALRRARVKDYRLVAVNSDRGGGTLARDVVTVRRPLARKRR
jgi:CubicO group peptidase (beta-lactamase class C family)